MSTPDPKRLPMNVVRKIETMIRDLKLQKERDKLCTPIDLNGQVYVTGTFLIDFKTGKILDAGFINGYDADGDPKYGCVTVRNNGQVSHRYGMCPPPDGVKTPG